MHIILARNAIRAFMIYSLTTSHCYPQLISLQELSSLLACSPGPSFIIVDVVVSEAPPSSASDGIPLPAAVPNQHISIHVPRIRPFPMTSPFQGVFTTKLMHVLASDDASVGIPHAIMISVCSADHDTSTYTCDGLQHPVFLRPRPSIENFVRTHAGLNTLVKVQEYYLSNPSAFDEWLE